MNEQLTRYQPNIVKTKTEDVINNLENLEESELLDIIQRTLTEETKLWVVRALAVKELVERKLYVTSDSYRAVLKELAEQLNASYTTLFYEYRIATTYHQLLVSHLTTEATLPNKDILILGLKLPNPDKFIENYHHDPSKTLQELKTEIAPAETPFPKNIIKIKLEVSESIAAKIQAILEVYGSLETFLLEKIKEVTDTNTIDVETFDDLLEMNEDKENETMIENTKKTAADLFEEEEELEEELEEDEEEEYEEEQEEDYDTGYDDEYETDEYEEDFEDVDFEDEELDEDEYYEDFEDEEDQEDYYDADLDEIVESSNDEDVNDFMK